MTLRRLVVFAFVLAACGDGRLSPQGGTVTGTTAGSGLTGGGTGGNVVLNVGAAVGGGIAVTADAIGLLTSCSASQGLVWSGVSWGCEYVPTGSGSTNSITKWTGTSTQGNSLLTDDGTTLSYNAGKFTVAAASGNATVAGTLGVTGAGTFGGTLGVTGLSTLTGGFTLGADSSAASHKITNLTNGSSAQDAAAFGQIGTAVNAAVSGTSGTYAVFSGTNAVGNSQFPISETSATALAIGDSQASDITTVSGRLVGTSTDSTTNPFSYALVATAGTGTSRAAIRGDMTGTFDTSSSAITNYAMWGDASGTKSNVGGNTLTMVGFRGFASGTADDTRGVLAQSSGSGTVAYGLYSSVSGTAATSRAVFAQATGAATLNIGVDVASSGGTTNIGYRNTTGDNYFNTSSSSTGIGYASGATLPGKLSVSGSTGYAVDVISSSGGTYGGVATPVARTTTLSGSARNFLQGTFDTTSGDLTAEAFRVQATSTRSAGSGSLTNKGIIVTASGGQTNTALETVSGANYLNTTGGNTGVGYTSAATLNGKLSVTSGGTAIYSESTGNRTFQGTVTFASNTTGVTGAVQSTVQGTVNTTSSTLTAEAGRFLVSTSRGAGSNNLTNRALDASASGAQINIAYQSDNGDNYFNASSGKTGAGYASGATLPSKLATTSSGFKAFDAVSTWGGDNAALFTWTPVAATTSGLAAVKATANGTFDTTGGTLSAIGFYADVTASRSAGTAPFYGIGVYSNVSGATNSMAIVTDNGNNYFNAIGGAATGVGYARAATMPGTLSVLRSTAGTALDVAATPSATSDVTAINQTAAGTLNASASARIATGGSFSVSTTKSAGANTLTNYALKATASGGDANIALQTDAGDVLLNTTGGTTTAYRSLTLDTSTSDLTGPELNYTGRNGGWVSGIDVANTTPSRDFVIAGVRGSFSFEDGATTSGSATLTSTAQGGFSSTMVGQTISGTGIPNGTTVLSVASPTSLTMSANATATASGVRVTVTRSTTDDIVYLKHRGSLSPTIGLGVTPPDGSYRVQIAASDSEVTMGGLGIRVGASQTANAFSVYDSTPTNRFWITNDFYLSGTHPTTGYAIAIKDNGTGSLTFTNAATATYGFKFSSNDTVFRYLTGGVDAFKVDTAGGFQTFNNTTLGDASSDSLQVWGHEIVQGNAPTLSSCGSSPTVVGTDTRGTITVGAEATACTVTFSRTWTNAPTCTVTSRALSDNLDYTTSATVLTLSSATGGSVYDYNCACVGGSCT